MLVNIQTLPIPIESHFAEFNAHQSYPPYSIQLFISKYPLLSYYRMSRVRKMAVELFCFLMVRGIRRSSARMENLHQYYFFNGDVKHVKPDQTVVRLHLLQWELEHYIVRRCRAHTAKAAAHGLLMRPMIAHFRDPVLLWQSVSVSRGQQEYT